MIYCPTCEAGCSEKADVCPKCGHPLAAPVDDKIISLVTLRTSKPYIIVTAILGLVAIAAYVYVNAPRGSRQQPSEAQSPYLDCPAVQPSSISDGLGFSVADFQRGLPASKGWAWTRDSSSNAARVVYRAVNASLPNFTCVVSGLELDIDKFTVIITIPRREVDDNSYLAHLIGSIGLLTSLFHCNSDELVALVTRSEKDFIAAKIPIDRHETIGGLDITASWVPAEGGLVFALAADAVPPAAP